MFKIIGLFTAFLIAVMLFNACKTPQKTIEKENRFSFFLGLSATLWIMSTITTVVGFYTAGVISKNIFIAIIYLNPIYFMCMIVAGLNKNYIILTVVLSVILSPILYLVTPSWSVLVAGLIAGITSYLIFIR